MNSKEYMLSEAERLYVIDNCDLTEIAGKTHISTRTLIRWKMKHDWETKRKEYLKSKMTFHEEAYEFTRKLMKDIVADIDAGEKIDQGRMYTFCKMIPMFTKIKNYEDLTCKKPEKEKPKGLTPEVIAQIEAQILGIIPQQTELEDDENEQ